MSLNGSFWHLGGSSTHRHSAYQLALSPKLQYTTLQAHVHIPSSITSSLLDVASLGVVSPCVALLAKLLWPPSVSHGALLLDVSLHGVFLLVPPSSLMVASLYALGCLSPPRRGFAWGVQDSLCRPPCSLWPPLVPCGASPLLDVASCVVASPCAALPPRCGLP